MGGGFCGRESVAWIECPAGCGQLAEMNAVSGPRGYLCWSWVGGPALVFATTPRKETTASGVVCPFEACWGSLGVETHPPPLGVGPGNDIGGVSLDQAGQSHGGLGTSRAPPPSAVPPGAGGGLPGWELGPVLVVWRGGAPQGSLRASGYSLGLAAPCVPPCPRRGRAEGLGTHTRAAHRKDATVARPGCGEAAAAWTAGDPANALSLSAQAAASHRFWQW